MRIQTIELLRYGHFSGQNLSFPQHEHDFHVILGRNEAGKSTLRQAFHDLLFGIPMNTPMAFLHGAPELALNAVLAGEAGQLAMGRRRKRDGGLVDAAGEKLAPEVLAGWLGGVTEAFYERMFGLDHRRLEQGSRAMLQAGDDVDSVLFQAAAGLATLNSVLAGLRDEAAGLWTPHHSRNRAWYAASDRYKAADKAVKDATVRPTRWAETRRESRRLDDAFTQARDACTALRGRLRELERLRRMAPLLTQIRDSEALLNQEETEPAAGEPLLAREAEIVALEETRLRVAGHHADINQCDVHINLLCEQLNQVLRQLGRPVLANATPDALAALAAVLPSLPQRRQLGQLLNDGKALRAQSLASSRARETRLTEIRELRARLADLPTVSVGQGLRRALEAATAAGDLPAALATLRRRAVQEEAELERRLAALQRPGVTEGLDINCLARMAPWPVEALLEQVQERRELRTAVDTAAKRVREAELELGAARLKAEQFRRSHQAVSRDEVMAARRERDDLWDGLESGQVALQAQAGRYASLVLRADVLADRHLEAVDDAARLQVLEHECERLQAAVQGLQSIEAAALAELDVHQQEWRKACEDRGLPDMPPAELQGWLSGRDTVLQVHERRLSTQAELVALEARHAGLLTALSAALQSEDASQAGVQDAVRLPDEADALQQACDAARVLLAQAEGAAARREALTEQLQRLELLLPALEQDADRDEAAIAGWAERRETALDSAGLPGDADDAYAVAAIELLSEADTLLGRLRGQQVERERLETELSRFHLSVAGLAQDLGSEDIPPDDVETALRHWVGQLNSLREVERDRQQARRQLAALNTRLLEEADGRDRKQIEMELAAVDLSTLASEAETLGVRIEEAEQQRDRLALEREQARAALDSISGGDDAALAEARRQEALADMSDVAERYVQVYAQYRLLEHITERYRERSQGPLLAHAGRLFTELTLGAHEGLVIDGEAATLWARRAGGRLTPLDGLSDGTRDQLYLALRLAALQLYLDSAEALPFIADDLFVNYDDGRALAGLRQLTEVSRRTQVIFLTHHAHMAELARDHLADRVNIIELSGHEATG